MHRGGGLPTDELAAFCGALPTGWIILDARDCQAKGVAGAGHRFIRSSFEPARSFAGVDDYQAELDRWVKERANPRRHQGIRAISAERLIEERKAIRSLPSQPPRTDLRFTFRVPPKPYFRFDRNDYSLDPRHRQDPPGDRDRDQSLPGRPAGRVRHRDRVGRLGDGTSWG